MPPSAEATATKPPPLLLAALSINAMFAWGLCFYGLGFYMLRLNELRGWSLSALSTMALLFYLAATALSFWVARLLATRGARFVFTLGAASTGLALLALPHVRWLWLLPAVYLLLAIGWTSTNSIPISTTVMAWFASGQRELSVALVGASFGGIVLIPLLGLLDDRYGFSVAMATVAMAEVVVVGGLARLVIDTPPICEHEGQRGDRAAWSLLTHPRFWVLATGLGLAIIVQGGFLVHQLSIVATVTSDATAASVVGATTLAALIGRLGPIIVGSRVAPAVVGAVYLLIQAVGLASMAALEHDLTTVTIGSVLFGVGIGVLVTMPSLLTRTSYPHVPYTSAFPVVNLAFQLSLATGAPLLAFGHRWFGSYGPTMWFLAFADLVAASLFLGVHHLQPGQSRWGSWGV